MYAVFRTKPKEDEHGQEITDEYIERIIKQLKESEDHE